MIQAPAYNLLVFVVYAVVMLRLHDLADHGVQTSHQAINKELPGRKGALACAGHIVTYHLVLAAFPTAAILLLGFPFTPWATVSALAVSVVTHYYADRRTGFLALLRRVGCAGMIDEVTVVRKAGAEARKTGPGTGAYALDQMWHKNWLIVCCLLLAIG